MPSDFMTLQEAMEELEVSRFTLWRLIKAGELPAYQAATDRRRKLVKREDIQALKTPKALNPKLAA